MTAVGELPRPKHLPTLASAPCHTDSPAEQASAPSLSQRDHNFPPAQQEPSQSSRPLHHAHVEDADDSETDQASGDSQRSANLDAWPQSDLNDDTYDQDARQDDQLSGQRVTSLIAHQSDTTQRKPSKRKQDFEGIGASKRAHIELADAAQAGTGSTDPHCSRLLEFQPVPDQNDESPMPQAEMSPDAVDPTDEGSDKFAKLPADLRAKVQRIADAEALANVWHFFNLWRNPLSFNDTRAGQGALERNEESHVATAKDRRLKQLKFLIEREIETEKSLKTLKMVARVSKRVHLVELTATYMEEKKAKKAASKRRRDRKLPRLSPMDRFTDLLFPETIKCKSEQTSRKKKGKQVSKKEKCKQVSRKEECPREAAKRTLEYWIRLGEPLVRMAQRFGHGILLLLPKELTDKE